MELLNIGCGAIFHPDWKNIDIVSVSPYVVAYDLRKKLPFEDSAFDAVYHSHLLEHLTPESALEFLKDIRRVLRKGGIMRIAIPDLEEGARLYLKHLDLALEGGRGSAEKHEWMVIELIDQLTRTSSGGRMRRFFLREDLQEKEFVGGRAGQEFQDVRNSRGTVSSRPRLSVLKKLMSKTPKWYLEKFRIFLAYLFLTAIGGTSMRETFKEGLFRRSGEVHQWMYDQFSIAKLLQDNDFADVKIMKFNESRIPDFNSFNLDQLDGVERKPSSLYVECRKL